MKRFSSLLIFFICVLSAELLYAQAPDFAWAVQSDANQSSDITGTLVATDTVNHFTYVAGWFEGGDIDLGNGPLENSNPSSGTHDIFIGKYTTGGSLVWEKVFGGYGDDALTGLAIDKNGNVFIAGNYNSDTLWFNNNKMALNPLSRTNIYMAKLDENGNTQWAKSGTLSVTGNISPSGNSMLAIDAGNNLFLTGSIVGTVYFGADSIDAGVGASMFVLKCDNDGNTIWSAASTPLTSNLNPGAVIPYAVNIDKDGNCLVVGAYTDDNQFGSFPVLGNNDVYFDRFAAKLDKNNGSFLWVTPQGVWQGPDINCGVSSDNSGNVYLTGYLTYPTAGPNSNSEEGEYFIEKLGTNGDSTWIVNSFFGSSLTGFYITTDGDGNSFLSLAVEDTAATFGNITIHIPYPNAFGVPGITTAVVKFDNSGNALWVRPTEGHGLVPMTLPGGIALDNNGCIDVAGTVNDTAYFSSHLLVGNTATNSLYMAGFCAGVTGINKMAENSLSGISLYPNPAADNVIVNWQVNTAANYTLVIANAEGQQVAENRQLGILNAGVYSNTIDVSALSSGFYLVGLKTGNSVTYRKLVIQK